MMPAAMPSATRMASITPKVGENPPISPPAPSSNRLPTKVRRSPNRFSSHGVSSIDSVMAIMKLAATHCARSWPRWKCRLRSGTATLTMVDDTMDDIVPSISVTRISQRRRSP
ncbi:hypothetical protein D3C72_910370 [compost metagenome]